MTPMKINQLKLLALTMIAGCGMFEDKYEQQEPIRLYSKYPGMLELTLVSSYHLNDRSADPTARNYLIIRNVSNDTLAGLGFLIDVFSGPHRTYDNLIRADYVALDTSIIAGSMDTITLVPTNDFFDFPNSVDIRTISLEGLPTNALKGFYNGTFSSYKNNQRVGIGRLHASIDILGDFKSQLQSIGDFNSVAGTLSNDSALFCTLNNNEITLKEIATKIESAKAGTLEISYITNTESSDSLVVQMTKVN